MCVENLSSFREMNRNHKIYSCYRFTSIMALTDQQIEFKFHINQSIFLNLNELHRFSQHTTGFCCWLKTTDLWELFNRQIYWKTQFFDYYVLFWIVCFSLLRRQWFIDDIFFFFHCLEQRVRHAAVLHNHAESLTIHVCYSKNNIPFTWIVERELWTATEQQPHTHTRTNIVSSRFL